MAKDNPSAPLNVDTFLRRLKKSGLLNESQFQELEAQANRESNNELATHIVQYCQSKQFLSPWQIDQLKSGRYKGFFLGNFKLIDVLGAGGMSAVFLAEHTLSGQMRAIKILPRKKIDERSYLTRFYREGRAVAALNHPNIIRIYDIAEASQTHYMVMEYVRGSDLHRWVKKNGPVNFKDGIEFIRQSAAGIGHAHQNKLIHRDIKPANIFLTENNSIKILDLGLALLKIDGANFGLSAQYNETMMGTADYLAPEQAVNSSNVDHRADIYSLGCTLYFLLTGQPPFPTGTLAQRIAAHQYNLPKSIRNFRDDCPENLLHICEKMMAKAPEDRFQSCEELIGTLSERSQLTIKNPAGKEHRDNIRKVSTQKIKRKRRNKYFHLTLLFTGLLLVIVILIVILVNQNR